MFIQGRTPYEIISELQYIYGDKALHKTQVYYWIGELKRGRIDLHDEPRFGRPPYEDLDDQIIACIKINPHDSCRSIAAAIACIGSTVYRRLTILGYKNVHLRWIPHRLNEFQKQTRLTKAKIMLQKLLLLKHDNFNYIATGDESWFCYYYDYKRKWVLDDDEIDERVEKTNYSHKTMITLFFTVNGLALLDAKPSNQSINSEYFVNNVLVPLEQNVKASDAKKHHKVFYVHFGNARAHTAKYANEHLSKFCLTLLPHPPYSPDLSPCDFGLFGTVKDSFQGRSFDSEKDLLDALYEFFSEKPRTFWMSIFENWIERLQKCINAKGNYF